MDSTLHDVFRAGGWIEDLAGALTILGGTDVLVASALVSVYLLRRTRRAWWESLGPLGSLWVCALLTSFLKDMVGRARPEAGADIASAAFPSGHASNTTAFVIALAVVVPRVTTAVSKQGALMAAVGISLVIGWTRLALGVHWATDVLAGWVIGGAVATVVMRIVAARTTTSR